MKHHLITKLFSVLATDFSARSKFTLFVRWLLRLGKHVNNFVYKLLQYRQHFFQAREIVYILNAKSNERIAATSI